MFNLKKIISLTAVVLLIFNSGAYVIVYQQLTILNRYNIYTNIENDEFGEETVLLSFKREDIENGSIDFNWKHKKEFQFNDEMYDIVESSETQDSVFFYCYHDKKEKKYEENFNKHYENEKGSDKQVPGGNFLAKIKLGDLFDAGIISWNQYSSKYNFPPCPVDRSYHAEIEIPSPPPKIFPVI